MLYLSVTVLLLIILFFSIRFVSKLISRINISRDLVEKTNHEKNSHITYAEKKGYFGERELYEQIAPTIEAGARIIWNCWLRWGNGNTTQVDIILICKSGIYVIESKNYGKCWIFGSMNNEYWTKCIYRYDKHASEKSRVMNPIAQNALHVKCIRQLLDDKTVPIYSIIAFSDETDLKRIPTSTDNMTVVNYRNLRHAIATFHSRTQYRISEDEISDINEVLTSCNASISSEEKRNHIDKIKSKYNS